VSTDVDAAPVRVPTVLRLEATCNSAPTTRPGPPALARVTRGAAASCGRRWRCGCLRRSCRGERTGQSSHWRCRSWLRVHRLTTSCSCRVPRRHRPVADCAARAAGGLRPADITPPPGVGLAGNGPEGRRPRAIACACTPCPAARGSDGRARRARRRRSGAGHPQPARLTPCASATRPGSARIGW